jgi:hypothetical protein
VMYRGRIIGELPAGADPGEIGLLMAGTISDHDKPEKPGQPEKEVSTP